MPILNLPVVEAAFSQEPPWSRLVSFLQKHMLDFAGESAFSNFQSAGSRKIAILIAKWRGDAAEPEYFWNGRAPNEGEWRRFDDVTEQDQELHPLIVTDLKQFLAELSYLGRVHELTAEDHVGAVLWQNSRVVREHLKKEKILGLLGEHFRDPARGRS